MRDAIATLVRDGDTVAIEGFTHLICFAAGHEIIRQRRRDLTLIRMTPDLIYDQMIGAGVARKLVFSWLGNPGVGGLHAIRRVTGGRGRQPGAGGVQPLRHGRPLHRGRHEPALLPAALATSRRTCRWPTRSSGRSAPPTATSWSTSCRRSGRTSPSSTRSARTRPATRRSGACWAPRRRPPSPPSGSSWWSRSSWTSRSSGPTPTGRSSPGSSWTPSSWSPTAPIRRTPRATTTATTASTSSGTPSAATPQRLEALAGRVGPRRPRAGGVHGASRRRRARAHPADRPGTLRPGRLRGVPVSRCGS